MDYSGPVSLADIEADLALTDDGSEMSDEDFPRCRLGLLGLTRCPL